VAPPGDQAARLVADRIMSAPIAPDLPPQASARRDHAWAALLREMVRRFVSWLCQV